MPMARRARRTAFTGFAALLAFGLPARAEDNLVIYDNDWNVPGSYIEQDALMPLFVSARVKVIGITSVTGDCWRDEGTASVLRYLEVVGRKTYRSTTGRFSPWSTVRTG